MDLTRRQFADRAGRRCITAKRGSCERDVAKVGKERCGVAEAGRCVLSQNPFSDRLFDRENHSCLCYLTVSSEVNWSAIVIGISYLCRVFSDAVGAIVSPLLANELPTAMCRITVCRYLAAAPCGWARLTLSDDLPVDGSFGHVSQQLTRIFRGRWRRPTSPAAFSRR